MNVIVRLLSIRVLLCCALAFADYRPPAGVRPAFRGAQGTVLPGGRVLQPAGVQLPTGPGTWSLAFSPSGHIVATANLGPERSSLTFFESDRKGGWTLKNLFTDKASARARGSEEFPSLGSGIVFANEKSVWISEGDSGKIRLIDEPSGIRKKSLDLNAAGVKNSFAGALAFDSVRELLYVVDPAHFRVVVFDVKKGSQLAAFDTGYLPDSIALSANAQSIFVANLGIFHYHVLPGATVDKARQTGIPFPAFGFPSPEAAAGTEVRNGAGSLIGAPALGDPNAPQSNSLAIVDVSQPAAPRLQGYIRTGIPFGPESVGGSAPSGVVVAPHAVYVSNAHDDTIDVIDPVTRSIRRSIELRIPGLETLRGILPLGMAYDPSRRWLLVAEAGLNAIDVIDTRTDQLIGHVPVGWFPAAVAIHDGKVAVANVKGRGAGPSSFHMQAEAADFAGLLRRGSVSYFPMPTTAELAKSTKLVLAANGLLPVSDTPHPAVPVKYVVMIVKENRTYDEVFGDLKTAANGSVAGDPALARFGEHGYADGAKSRLSLQHIAVTPNHHALAARFAFSDNFYADSDVSVDGHHWITGNYPDAWTENSLLTAYSGQKHFALDDSAPGRLLFAESNSSVHPEEQEQAGSLWQHLERNGIPFRNFGEGFELAGNDEGPGLEPTGARLLTNIPMPDALFRNTSRDYPGFNMNIPDQYRATQFISEIEKRYAKTGQDLPRLLFIHLPNDHIAEPRPLDGYPYAASYVADNDYASGRIVEYLSHSPWWPRMAIFVTEDDAQGGRDHIDAHRTLLLGIGPYFKKNYASHVNASFPALLKTVFRVLGMPPLNLFDASAADLGDMFSTEPDLTPFVAALPDSRVARTGLRSCTADPDTKHSHGCAVTQLRSAGGA